jgi:hypothetical protein
MEAFISYFIQFHWLPFLGMIIFGVIAFLEYRSYLGIFSPSGLTSFYAFIKFSAESILILNYTSLVSLASLYNVTEESHISQAILISFLVTSLYYIILWRSSYHIRSFYALPNRYRTQNFIKKKIKFTKNQWIVSIVSLRYFAIFVFGLFFLFFIFQSAGGILYFLNNLSKKTEMLAGYGAPLKFSGLFIQIAILYFFSVNYKTSRKNAFLILFFGALVLFSLGGRTAPIFLIFTSIIYIHFYHKKFTFTFKFFFFFTIIFIGAVIISILRFPNLDSMQTMQLSDIPFSFWFSIFGGYFSYLIRDSVIISYFSENEFWYGSGLLSFFYAFIPRSLYPDKPVIDNGIYVIAMTDGQKVMPPMTPESLPHYGWPEGYMAGYMEAGWIGLFLGVILSCYLINYIFLRMVKSDFKIEWVFLYSFLVFRHPTYISSIDLFNITFNIIVVLGLGFLIRKRFVF